MSDIYTWTTTGSGDWNSASNWFDLTTGLPAAAAPGPADTAEIDNVGTAPITITGPADVSDLAINGEVILDGSYTADTFEVGAPEYSNPIGAGAPSTVALAGSLTAGSLAIGNLSASELEPTTGLVTYGVLEVDPKATLSAGSIGVSAGVLQVDGGSVDIANDLTLGADLGPPPPFTAPVRALTAPVLATGSLEVSDFAGVQIGSVLDVTDGSIGLDASSTLEIGNAGTAAAGTITIDPGAMLNEGDNNAHIYPNYGGESVTINAPILNNGTIHTPFDVSGVVNNGIIVANNGYVSMIGGDGTLGITNSGTVGPNVSGTLDLGYSGSVLFDLGAGVPIDTTDTPRIANFGTVPGTSSGPVELQGVSADAAIFTSTGQGIGTLTLDSGTSHVASLAIVGTFDRNSFLATTEGDDTFVTLNTLALTPTYTWISTGSGDWGDASNWFDVATGTPATVAPGIRDTAEIDNPGSAAITITGPASVASLDVSGDVILAGSFTTASGVLGVPPLDPSFLGPTITSTIALDGSLVARSLTIGDLYLAAASPGTPVADYGVVEVGQGAVLSAGSVTLKSGDLRVDGGAVSIGNGLTLGIDLFPNPSFLAPAVTGGSLDVTNHASVQLGGLAITDGNVNLDATSTLELCDAGTATAGTITIDPGALLMEGDDNSYVETSAHAAETALISAPVLNNGSIYSDQNLSDVINNGRITAENDLLSFIGGNGVVNLGFAGTIGPGDSGTFDITFGDTVVIALGAGVPIDLTDTPLIAGFGTDNTLEAIVLQDITANTATYTATGAGTGTLALYDGTSQVASLAMLGNYASDQFNVGPQSGSSFLTLNSVPVTNTYTWTAPGSGDWSSAANWFDISTGMPAVTPPGPVDTAEIDNPGSTSITVSGPGDVSGLLVSGNVTLAGSFTADSFVLGIPPGSEQPSPPPIGSPGPTLTSTIALAGNFVANSVTVGYGALLPPALDRDIVDYGVVEVDPGTTLAAASIALTSGDLAVDGGVVSDAGFLHLGSDMGNGGTTEHFFDTSTLDVIDGASVSAARMDIINGNVRVDATSTLEIGRAGTAAAGMITVDPDAIVEGGAWDYGIGTPSGDGRPTQSLSAPVLNNGTIFAGFDLSNTINNGVIHIADGTLSSISGNGQIVFSPDSTIGPNVSGTLSPEYLYDISGVTITFALGSGVPIDTTDTPRIADFIPTEALLLQGIGADTATYAPTGTGIGTLTLNAGTNEAASLTLLGTYTGDTFRVTPESGGSLVTLSLPCFAAGTRIATPRGEVAVETLSPGDEVSLGSGGTAPIIWIGHRRVDCLAHPKPRDIWPVRIRRGAFAPGQPSSDLFLSPDHAVFAEAVLIPIKYLIDGDNIRQIKRKSVRYFHFELPAHNIVLANGLAVESYLDTGDRTGFDNAGRVVALFPVFSPSFVWEACGYAPLVVTGSPVEAARRRIEDRAACRASRRRERRIPTQSA